MFIKSKHVVEKVNDVDSQRIRATPKLGPRVCARAREKFY